MSEWKGWYQYAKNKYPMTFQNFNLIAVPGYAIEGKGSDQVGTFVFKYTESISQLVMFEKRYYGNQNHTIYYEGVVEGPPYVIKGWWGWGQGNRMDIFQISRV